MALVLQRFRREANTCFEYTTVQMLLLARQACGMTPQTVMTWCSLAYQLF